jgi:hypothetical protein
MACRFDSLIPLENQRLQATLDIAISFVIGLLVAFLQQRAKVLMSQHIPGFQVGPRLCLSAYFIACGRCLFWPGLRRLLVGKLHRRGAERLFRLRGTSRGFGLLHVCLQ